MGPEGGWLACYPHGGATKDTPLTHENLTGELVWKVRKCKMYTNVLPIAQTTGWNIVSYSFEGKVTWRNYDNSSCHGSNGLLMLV